MDVLLLALLTTLNALFAMSEMALSTSRRARLAALAETGDAGAEAALRLMEEPTHFLSTVQIGITSIGMLSGIVGEAAFAAPLAVWMESLGMGRGTASVVSTAVVVTGITFFTIIFGELVRCRRTGLFTVEQLAEIFSCSVSTVWRTWWISEKPTARKLRTRGLPVLGAYLSPVK